MYCFTPSGRSMTGWLVSRLQRAADQALQWSVNNHMLVNSDKRKELLMDYSRKPSSVPNIIILGKDIERVHITKLLGVTITSDVTWGEHVDTVHSKAAQQLYFLTLLRCAGMPPQSMLRVFTAVVRPLTEYVCLAWDTALMEQQSDELESIQQWALKIILPELSYKEVLVVSGLPTLRDCCELLCRQFFQAMLQPGHCLHHFLPEK